MWWRGTDTVDVLGEIWVRAHLSDRVIDDISVIPARRAPGAAAGQPGRPGVPLDGRQVAARRGGAGQPAAPVARRLGRCGAGLRLCGAARRDHSGCRAEAACRHRRQHGGYLRGVRPEASLVGYARRNGTIPSVHGPVAPPLETGRLHAVEPLRAHGMRRFRRLDLRPATRCRRISMPTSATPTSTAKARRRSCTSIRSRVGGHVDANRHLGRCGGAGAAVAGVPRRDRQCGADAGDVVVGVAIRIRDEFVGTSTCTHLNDTLRAIADLDALLDLRDSRAR